MIHDVVRKRYPLRVVNHRRVPVTPPGQGYMSIRDGALIGEVEVEVDFGGLAAVLGELAIRAKGKKSIEAGGLVVVRAYNVRKEGRCEPKT